jgi:hypothetical protein
MSNGHEEAAGAHGPRFGWFALEDELARVAEARVFVCHHLPAHRSYVLRVPEAEGAWGDEPPSNAVLERANARATAAATASLHARRRSGRRRAAIGQVLVMPEYYGVLDQRYLVPLSAAYRRRDAIGFEQLLLIPSALIRILPFWENLWLLLVSETGLLARGTVPFEAWRTRWSDLVRGSGLGRQLLDDLPEGTGDRLGAEIAALVHGDELGPGPSLEESAVLRLMTAVTASRLDEAQVSASLTCPFFRMNVTAHDLHYAVALSRLMEPQSWLVQSALEWLGPTILALPRVLDGLLEQPVAFPDDGGAFEPCPPPDDATMSRFPLLVQDPERTVRPFIALERAPDVPDA